MKRALILTVALGALAAAHSADAAFVKRKLLLESCSGANEKDCTGYIVGIADASDASEVCVGDIKVPALKAKVIPWLKAHKTKPDEPAAPWVKEALKANFPCK